MSVTTSCTCSAWRDPNGEHRRSCPMWELPAGQHTGHRQAAVERVYRCCSHCKDDAIHDVPENGHDLPCDLCQRDAALAAERQRGREELAQAWDEGFEAASEWIMNNGRVGIPHDPPLNPHDRAALTEQEKR